MFRLFRGARAAPSAPRRNLTGLSDSLPGLHQYRLVRKPFYSFYPRYLNVVSHCIDQSSSLPRTLCRVSVSSNTPRMLRRRHPHRGSELQRTPKSFMCRYVSILLIVQAGFVVMPRQQLPPTWVSNKASIQRARPDSKKLNGGKTMRQ